MKLYDLHRNTCFKLTEPGHIPPCAPQVSVLTIYKLHNIDGMYSYCTDASGNVFHIAAFDEVEVVEGF